ncbi:hypothetical protein [Streptomyces coffeae]|uniref:PH domain-containing protein n=1 Tax=Streptomyces coffeae TaxID=621382 RepID=A0ABS1NH33_9ACTN|nr:hypothetical protein [Streptomyces coffeae]MBL1099247.1 hypothetical protein [Streptomyces coffeae]
MLPPHTPSPAPNATVIKTGHRTAMTGLPCSILLMAMGAVGIFGAVLVATGNQKGESSVAGFVGLAFMVALGVLGVILFIPIWAGRRTRVLVDRTGLWVEQGNLRNVIAWRTLTGVGLYWSALGRKGKIYSLELYPNGPIDRDDPVLWVLVRDEEPLHPGLPRLRHRLPLSAANQRPVVAAVQPYIPPEIWLGESQRPAGHIGRPDVKGHRERTRGRTP